jgi:hypothetical protein
MQKTDTQWEKRAPRWHNRVPQTLFDQGAAEQGEHQAPAFRRLEMVLSAEMTLSVFTAVCALSITSSPVLVPAI